MPDDDIFTVSVYDFNILSTRLRELAFLNKGIKLSITDKRETDESGEFIRKSFFSDEGLKDFINYLDATREKLMPEPICIEGEKTILPLKLLCNTIHPFPKAFILT